MQTGAVRMFPGCGRLSVASAVAHLYAATQADAIRRRERRVDRLKNAHAGERRRVPLFWMLAKETGGVHLDVIAKEAKIIVMRVIHLSPRTEMQIFSCKIL